MAAKTTLPEVHLPAREVALDTLLASALLDAARGVATHHYAPFSRFPVGAAAIMADDPARTVFTGCNVENSAYGETLCAERNAITTAAAAGFRKIALLALSTPETLHAPLANRSPCGACRQVIHEFSTPETLVLIDAPGSPDVLDLPRLLPFAFGLNV